MFNHWVPKKENNGGTETSWHYASCNIDRCLSRQSTPKANLVRRSNFRMLQNIQCVDVWKGMPITVNDFCGLIPVLGTILNVLRGLNFHCNPVKETSWFYRRENWCIEKPDKLFKGILLAKRGEPRQSDLWAYPAGHHPTPSTTAVVAIEE